MKRKEQPPKKAPGKTPSPTDRPQQAPGAPEQPDAIEAPPAEPSTSTDSDDANDTKGVDRGEAHMGATEEQVGDRTGPGAGYDESVKRRRE